MNPLIQIIRDKLTALGDTKEAVRANLAAQGIKGVRCNSHNCPLARVVQTVPGATDSSVGTSNITVFVPHSVETIHCAMPPACIEFIRDFDTHNYSELTEEEAA